MASVGERIRMERENRNTTLDDMSVATGIGHSYLESLEKGEYHELPGPAFGKLYIRAYAEVLGFDPQPWIEEYDREHRLLRGASPEPNRPAPPGSRPMAAAIARWRESKMASREEEEAIEPEQQTETSASEPAMAAEPEPPAAPVEREPEEIRETTAAPPPPEIVRPGRRRILVPFLVVIGLSLVAGFVIRAWRQREPAKPATAPAASAMPAPTPSPTVPPSPAPSPSLSPSASPLPPPLVAPKPAAPVSAPASPTAASSNELRVTEFGVGRRIVNLALEGQSDRFTEGDRVSFSSRVVGGRRGNVIRHVWIYGGRAQQTITLRLGGSDYRTHTNKTVGKAGPWAVEARDDSGRVLARAEFTVEPRSR